MRRRAVRIFCLFVYGMISQNQATVQENFLRAHELYEHGEYTAASQLYDSISNKGAAVWFNYGNCLYHLKRYPEALASWKRALKTGGKQWRSDIDYNVCRVQKILGIDQQSRWYTPLFLSIDAFSMLWWQMVVLGLLVGALIYLFFSRWRAKRIVSILFITVLTCVTSCLCVKYWDRARVCAILKEDRYLMAGTDERFSTIEAVKQGEEVIVYEQDDAWVKVAAHKNIGWMPLDSIIII